MSHTATQSPSRNKVSPHTRSPQNKKTEKPSSKTQSADALGKLVEEIQKTKYARHEEKTHIVRFTSNINTPLCPASDRFETKPEYWWWCTILSVIW